MPYSAQNEQAHIVKKEKEIEIHRYMDFGVSFRIVFKTILSLFCYIKEIFKSVICCSCDWHFKGLSRKYAYTFTLRMLNIRLAPVYSDKIYFS